MIAPRIQRGARAAAVCLFAALPIWAADAQIFGVSVGVVYEANSHSLRRIVGAAGASYLADALVSDLESAAVSPDGSVALAIREGHVYAIGGLKTGSPTEVPLGEAATGSRIGWSANSRFAVVSSAESRSLQVLHVEDSVVKPYTEAPLAVFSGSVTAVLPANTGDAFGVAVEGEGVFRMASDGSATLLAQAQSPVSIAFGRGDADLLFADASNGTLVEAQDWQSTVRIVSWSAENKIINKVQSLCLFRNQKMLVVAAESGSLEVHELQTHTLRKQIPTGRLIQGVQPLDSGDILVRFGDGPNQSLEILEATNDFPLFFVPSERKE